MFLVLMPILMCLFERHVFHHHGLRLILKTVINACSFTVQALEESGSNPGENAPKFIEKKMIFILY